MIFLVTRPRIKLYKSQRSWKSNVNKGKKKYLKKPFCDNILALMWLINLMIVAMAINYKLKRGAM